MTFDDLLSDVNEGPEPETVDDTADILRQFRHRLLCRLDQLSEVESLALHVPQAGEAKSEFEVRFAGGSIGIALTVQE